MADNSISKDIYLSRDQIRNQITEYMKSYLELENIDLTKSSFLTFMIDVLSTLTSNLMFYQSSVYNEFFLTKAQLPDSIFNLAAFLGYSPSEATYSAANLLMTVPFGFSDVSVTFTLPENFTFKAGDTEFVTYYDTEVTILNNSTVTIQVTQDTNKIYNLPVDIDLVNSQFQFVLPVRQYKENIQEFQIDSNLALYQFESIDVPFEGKISTISVVIQDLGNPLDTGTTYTSYDSLYLMSNTATGYVSRRTSSGVTLYFGNGLIGVQPAAGATVTVNINETQGADGNVIAGSITDGARIYVTDEGVTQIVKYTVTNASPAVNGTNEEGIEDIRSNAIASLTSLGRLVTEGDYQATSVVIPTSPIAGSAIPVLKRSDLKANEIQLFTTLEFSGSIVPTRNVWDTFDSTSIASIDRGTIITVGGIDYYTLFDMTTDLINNSAGYQYIMYEIEVIPTLSQSWPSNPYEITADQLTVVKNGLGATYTLDYTSIESDSTATTCVMSIFQNSTSYNMTNTGTSYTYDFADYTDIPDGLCNYTFTISDSTPANVAAYITSLTFRQDLQDFMASTLTYDGTSATIYDIPVIQKTYYDGLGATQKEFELTVLQTMLSSMDFVNYRMLTDFTNVKFTDTTGPLNNMLLNVVTKDAVTDILSTPPLSPDLAERYIVEYDNLAWSGHKNEIATCTNASTVTWAYLTPSIDDIIYVTDQASNYIYTPTGWIVPTYEIPFSIDIEVIKESITSSTDADIITNIKDGLYEEFSSRFGAQFYLYRSEIIDIVQNITGVSHCKLLQPESSIFTNFEIDNFTQQELLEYAPEYIYFEKTNISVRVI